MKIAGFNFHHLVLQLEGTLRDFQPFCRTLVAFLSLGKVALLDFTQDPNSLISWLKGRNKKLANEPIRARLCNRPSGLVLGLLFLQILHS